MYQANLFEVIENKNIEDIIVVSNDKEAKEAKVVFDYLDKKAFVLPDIRLIIGDDTRSYWLEIAKAFEALRGFYATPNSYLIAPYQSLTLRLPKKEYLKSFTIEFGESYDIKKLQDMLYFWGYSL